MANRDEQESDNRLSAWYESLLQFPGGVDVDRLLARVMEDREEQAQALREWFRPPRQV